MLAEMLGRVLADLYAGLTGTPEFSGISRLAVAAYKPATNELVALAHCGTAVPALDAMCTPLDQVPSLAILASSTQPRVIGDLRLEKRGPLTLQLLAAECRASMTVPLWHGDSFLGFLFVDSRQPHYFNGWRTHELARIAGAIARIMAAPLAA